MPDVPERFTIAPLHQVVPSAVLTEIDRFIRVFDRVTSRPTWRRAVTALGPEIARPERPERCFFSAWDFHLPPGRPEAWQLIEFNDNGSGFLFASLVNRQYYEVSGIGRDESIEVPVDYPTFARRVSEMIRTETDASGAKALSGMVLILDDADSLREGRFRHELVLLRDLCRGAGWTSEICSPEDLRWERGRLLCEGERVASVINRTTDFYWEEEVFSALRAAYVDGSVYVAPNPFTYATRSSKHLLEFLSRPVQDAELGIEPEERALLSAHVPETRVLRPDNVDDLARERCELFFKPCHGFASHGLLPGTQVGAIRLRRLLKKGEWYVAQRRAPKSRLQTDGGVGLWLDLRVWAYREERFLLSGRASRHADRLDLSPPGGWLPTYAGV
jgi:hypothetical protein